MSFLNVEPNLRQQGSQLKIQKLENKIDFNRSITTIILYAASSVALRIITSSYRNNNIICRIADTSVEKQRYCITCHLEARNPCD